MTTKVGSIERCEGTRNVVQVVPFIVSARLLQRLVLSKYDSCSLLNRYIVLSKYDSCSLLIMCPTTKS